MWEWYCPAASKMSAYESALTYISTLQFETCINCEVNATITPLRAILPVINVGSLV